MARLILVMLTLSIFSVTIGLSQSIEFAPKEVLLDNLGVDDVEDGAVLGDFNGDGNNQAISVF